MDESLDRIDRYIRKQMTDMEVGQFLAELEADPELARETKMRAAEWEAMERLIGLDMRQQMAVLEMEAPVKMPDLPNRKWPWVLLVVVLLSGIFLWLRRPGPEPLAPPPVKEQVVPDKPLTMDTLPKLQNNQPPLEKKAPQIQKQTIIPIASIVPLATPADVQTLVRGDNEPENPLNPAFEAFGKGDMAGALRLLSNISDGDPVEVLWLRGHIFWEQRKFGAAAGEFRKLTALHSDQFRDRDEWMLLLALVCEKGMDGEEQQQIMGRIKKDKGHTFYEELDRLKGVKK